MRTVADRSILGSPSSEVKYENRFLYGGGGEIGRQLFISVADFCALSSADIVDIGSSVDIGVTDSTSDSRTTVSSSTQGEISVEVDLDTIKPKKTRRERLSSQLLDMDGDKSRAPFMYQPSTRKIRGESSASNEGFVSMKSVRRERWLAAISSTGLPAFSAKLLRDYSMLQDSGPFFEMLSLYDVSPTFFPGELSRYRLLYPIESMLGDIHNNPFSGMLLEFDRRFNFNLFYFVLLFAVLIVKSA
jgi:hypothetical protein